MFMNDLEPGDIIFAAVTIDNDGTMPGFEDSERIADKGQRGVIINTGHVEDRPDKPLYLVRFETKSAQGELGPAVACWPEELTIPEEFRN